MSFLWNALMEIQRRESGIRNSMDFQKACVGSRFMVEKINPSHFVGDDLYTVEPKMSFNSRGDLLCSPKGRFISIYDWANGNLKHKFDAGIQLDEANFFNYGDNDCEILATEYFGRIVRYSITATGEVKSSVYNIQKGSIKLTSVPRKPFEVIGVQSAGEIFQLDLRTSQTVCANECVCNIDGVPVRLHDVDHHPTATEICVAGRDGSVRIFDTRNCKKSIFELSTNFEMRMEQCLYNYNGTEVLTSNTKWTPYEQCVVVFDNKIHSSGNIIDEGEDVGMATYFGPKSEYIIYPEKDANILHFHCKEFQIEKIGVDHSISIVKPHPFLPVIASTFSDKPITIWAPTTNKYCQNCKCFS